MSRILWGGACVAALCALAGCEDKVNYQASAEAQADAQDDTSSVPDLRTRDVRETEPLNPDVREPEPVDIGSPEDLTPAPDLVSEPDLTPEPDLPPEPACGPFDSNWTVVSRVALGRTDFDQIWDIDIQADRAYVTHSVGVTVLDVSVPASPDILGVFEAVQPGARALALVQTPAGLGATLAVLGDGVRKLSIPPNLAPVETGAYDLSGSAGAEYASDVEVVGGIAYVTSYSQGLWILNVSSASPQPLGSCCQNREGNLLDGPAAVAVSDGVAYVADNTSGLRVVDFSDPSSPAVVGSLEVEGAFQAVEIDGDVLVMGSEEGTLLRVDVSAPSNPRVLNELSLRDGGGIPVPIAGLSFTDDVAFVAGGALGVYVVSFASEPPRLYNLPFGAQGDGVFSVKLDGDLAYVADGDILTIMQSECP